MHLDTVRLIIRNLVFMVLLAAFLEMLLPLKSSRRFLQVVLGLFVLAVVLNPLVTWLKQPPLISLDESVIPDHSRMELDAILNRGKELQAESTGQARQAYIRRLEEQVEVMAKLVPGVVAASARVTLASDSEYQSLGAVQQVVVTLTTDGQQGDRVEIKPVPRVMVEGKNGEISQGASPTEVAVGDREKVAKVREMVASLFGLRADQVKVSLKRSAE